MAAAITRSRLLSIRRRAGKQRFDGAEFLEQSGFVEGG